MAEPLTLDDIKVVVMKYGRGRRNVIGMTRKSIPTTHHLPVHILIINISLPT